MNIQTIPREQKSVKKSFYPKLDAFLSLDYPNIELKLLGYYLDALGYPSMVETFRGGADLHVRTASGIFGKQESAVTDIERQTGKTLNFSIVYGGGMPTLLRQGVASDPKQALDILRKFHSAWPGIGWQTKRQKANHGTLAWWIDKRLVERGYITTLWGRHLHPRSDHAALNALVQGCAADLMKWALVNVHRELQQRKMKSHLVVTVHDNAVLDCAASELEFLAEHVPDWMTYKEVQNIVPIRPAPEVSYDSWADLKAWERTIPRVA